MDKDEELLRILGELRGGSLADITDKLLALFREPEWWEEEFDAKFVARGSIGAFQDADKRDAVKSFISTLLTRAQQEERQKLIMEIESLRDCRPQKLISPANCSFLVTSFNLPGNRSDAIPVVNSATPALDR